MKPHDLPSFDEQDHYRQLHPTREGGRRWRFVTQRGIRLPVKGITDTTIVYHDSRGKPWARHDRFGVYVEAGYAWNGCSPKRWVWPFGWMGTPDFDCTRLASLVHDIHYQFCRTAHFPLHKCQVDSLFYECIAMTGNIEIASLYHGAVVKHGRWSEKPHNGEYSTLL
jgi:hypothetical protein